MLLIRCLVGFHIFNATTSVATFVYTYNLLNLSFLFLTFTLLEFSHYLKFVFTRIPMILAISLPATFYLTCLSRDRSTIVALYLRLPAISFTIQNLLDKAGDPIAQ
jgi:inner membrane protein involved in colicin E2 resistance